MGVKVWGTFLIAVGAGLLIFSKPYVAKVRGFLPIRVVGSWFLRLMNGSAFLSTIVAVATERTA